MARSWTLQGPVAIQVISGFLGAGKTTLLQQLLAHKPAGARWAVIINEFGQIGLDAALLNAEPEAGYCVRELAGGCVCCSSRLPLEVTLGRLIREQRPQRIWIEPTGLADPAALLELFAEPRWRSVLVLHSWLTVVDGSQLMDERLNAHPLFWAQLQAADTVWLSHQAQMQPQHWARWQQLKTRLDPPQSASSTEAAPARRWLDEPVTPMGLSQMIAGPPRQSVQPRPQPLLTLHPRPDSLSRSVDPPTRELPWHYQQQALGRHSAGWQLPPQWQFDHDRLLVWVLGLKGWERLKGVLHTNRGWLALNMTPASLGVTAHSGHEDNRLEIIADHALAWAELERGLLACRVRP